MAGSPAFAVDDVVTVALGVVVVELLVVALGVVVLGAGALGVVVGGGAVVLGAGVDVWLDVELELDPCEPFEEWCEPDEPFEPPSGSTYCWSPADGPVASAAAGPRSATALKIEKKISICRHESIARVLQAMRQLVFGDLYRDRAGRGAWLS